MPVCPWARNEPERTYHDLQWGVPVYDDRLLFEFITLEGAQAGLSWSTILKKREGYRRAFCGWDVEKIARLNARSVERLMQDASIVRNRAKIQSTLRNARAFLALQEQFDGFAPFIWQFVDGRPIINQFESMRDVPAKTAISDAMSKALKQAGFNFVGSTICYAFMQAVGMTNDHLMSCPRWAAVQTGADCPQ